VPTLVVSGTEDEVCPIELQQELVAGVPGACLVSLAGAGHMGLLERPSEVATHLATWLGS
ncbi:MAG: alpha/beta hydrolase, partial [Mycobacteriales bacterium]